jgi:signal transduction histidine kinase
VTQDPLSDDALATPVLGRPSIRATLAGAARGVVGASAQQVWRLDASLIGSVLLLSVVSAATWLGPLSATVPDARALDIAINVSAILVGSAVAVLAWARWRDTGEPEALYVCSAFIALTLINGLVIGIVFAGRDADFGLSPGRPGDAPVYLWTVTRLAAAYLLVVGAVRSLRREQPPVPTLFLLLGPAGLLIAVGAMLFGREAVLPPIPAVGALDPGGLARSLTPTTTLIGSVQVSIFAGFIVAAILFRRLYIRDRRIADAYLAVGLVSAAFSQLHFLIAPIAVIGIVTSADALRLAFYGVLLLGIQAELSADLRALRRANIELERLREVDAANAVMAERTRLAREIHDGLAQDLWYAKLKQGRLVQKGELPQEDRTTAGEVLHAIDSALSDARQAVMAMRLDASTGSSLTDVLRSYVDDFSDRFGIRAEFDAAELPSMSTRTEAEILRIVQEALNNIHRHADATRVWVRTGATDGVARIAVSDNGKGFDPAAVAVGRFGLGGMRERAALIGEDLDIRSQPSDGTTITIEVPLGATALPRDGR